MKSLTNRSFKAAIALLCVALFAGSCAVPGVVTQSNSLMNTSTYLKPSAAPVVTAVFADLDVSPTKITYFYLPSKTVLNGGYDNVINTAVREALLANGNADVLVALESQVKYTDEGKIESVTITGYPAKYVNFRNPGDDYLKGISAPKEEAPAGGILGKVKLGQ